MTFVSVQRRAEFNEAELRDVQVLSEHRLAQVNPRGKPPEKNGPDQGHAAGWVEQP